MPLILIVEDDATILDLLQQVLGDDGYATQGVANGQAALTAIEAHRPDCILLDLHLPIVDGEGVLRVLVERGTPPPVLLMTSDRYARRFNRADGVVGHIPKPFDLDHLSVAVEMALHIHSDGYPTGEMVD